MEEFPAFVDPRVGILMVDADRNGEEEEKGDSRHGIAK
jgi:hypothetical protein